MLVPTQIGEERRRRLTHRALPALGLVVAAFLCGVLVGALRDTDAERTAKRFAKAREMGDYRCM